MRDREGNIRAWEHGPTGTKENLESSLFKISGFINKCRAINAQSANEVLREAPKLRLDKYRTELTEALIASATKVSKPADIIAFSQVLGALHRQLGSQFTDFALPRILKSAEQTKKIRFYARLCFELYFDGVLRDSQLAKDALVPLLDPSKSTPYATVKLLRAYESELEEFTNLIEKYAENLESFLQPESKTSQGLLLSEELDKINEEQKERIDNMAAYIDLCETFGRKPSPQISGAVNTATSTTATTPATPEPSNVYTPTPTTPALSSAPSTPKSRPHTPSNTLKWNVYENQLTTMSSPEQVAKAAASFVNADTNVIRKTTQLLLDNPRVHMLVWYTQFLALVPSLAEKVSPEVVKRALENPLYLKYTAELTKAQVITTRSAVDVLIKLTRPTLQAQSIFTFVEACGEYLSQDPASSDRIIDFREYMKKLPASTAQERQLIDGSITYLEPSQERTLQTESVDLESFVQHLLYRELQKSKFSRILRLLQKLSEQQLLAVSSSFIDCSAISADNLYRVGQITATLCASSTALAYRILDEAIENFQETMTTSMNRQTLVSQTILLASLQAHGLIPKRLFMYVFDDIIQVPGDKFRLKLVCILISNCDLRTFDAQSLLGPINAYRDQVEVDLDLASVVKVAVNKLISHQPPPADDDPDQSSDEGEDSTDNEEVEDEEESQVVSDYEEEDEDFEKELMKLTGTLSAPAQATAVKSPAPVSVNISALKIAKR